MKSLKEYCCESCHDIIFEEAEYDGRKVKLNDPIRTSENKNKKFKVYVNNENGKVIVEPLKETLENA